MMTNLQYQALHNLASALQLSKDLQDDIVHVLNTAATRIRRYEDEIEDLRVKPFVQKVRDEKAKRVGI